MQRIVEGDRDAFGRIVAAHTTEIFRFAYSLLGEESRAEDIVQETCLRLWNKADQWTPSGRVKSWLLRIAHNLCMDEIRKRRENICVDTETIILPDTRPDQAKVFADRQISQLVNAALFSLPERQRTALMLVYYHDRSNGEAAYVMGLSVEAVESLLARGRKNLRDALWESRKTLLEG